MPRSDNAVVLAAQAVERLAAPTPARMTEVTAAFLDGAIAATRESDPTIARHLGALRSGGPEASALLRRKPRGLGHRPSRPGALLTRLQGTTLCLHPSSNPTSNTGLLPPPSIDTSQLNRRK
jgi:hypothetical protein